MIVQNNQSLSRSEAEKESCFYKIDKNLLRLIFSYLDCSSLNQSSVVCRRWNLLSKNNTLWKKIFLRAFSPVEKVVSYRQEFIETRKSLDIIDLKEDPELFDPYERWMQGDFKVRNGKIYTSNREFKIRNGALDNSNFFEIKVWDFDTRKCLNTISIEDRGLSHFDVFDQWVICSTYNGGKISVFAEDSGQCSDTIDLQKLFPEKKIKRITHLAVKGDALFLMAETSSQSHSYLFKIDFHTKKPQLLYTFDFAPLQLKILEDRIYFHRGTDVYEFDEVTNQPKEMASMGLHDRIKIHSQGARRQGQFVTMQQAGAIKFLDGREYFIDPIYNKLTINDTIANKHSKKSYRNYKKMEVYKGKIIAMTRGVLPHHFHIWPPTKKQKH